MKIPKTKNLKPKKDVVSDTTIFSVVGIGASAGGFEALEQFFGNLPADSGMAFVVIQHLDPTNVGIMPELLQRTTSMSVVQVTDNLQVQPNCIYVIPPNKSMSILNGVLHLFEPIETRGLRLPIDFFFRSLADDKREKSIGIILSGMGSDGSLGVKAIKEKGGLVLVQNPKTSKFDAMPRSAIAAVNVDILADATELPAKLIDSIKHSHIAVATPEIENNIRINIEKIIFLLRSQTGHDFSLYKRNTMFRRIERRLNVHQITKIDSYVRFLQENPKELEILFKELLIGVTNFFRDAAVWENLKDAILPKLLNELPNGYILRAWIPACSTGEEAYSLAIVFCEAMEKLKIKKNITLQIFATDLDTDSIDKARKGIFAQNIVADVSAERINNFFTPIDNYFRVNNSIREMIVFAPQNITKDPPFTKLDFLSCRNLLIYMEPELQKKMMNLFHYSLNTGGIMLLGIAESENSQKNLFTLIHPKLKIFKRMEKTLQSDFFDFPTSILLKKKSILEDISTVTITENIQTLTDQILLQRFTPASVLTNEFGDILYISGRTGKYLEPSVGKANMNIHAMAREGLRNYLPAALRKAKLNYEPVIISHIKIGTNGGTQIVKLTIQQIEKPDAIKGTFILVFTDIDEIVSTENVKSKKGKNSNINIHLGLELELQRHIVELQNTREEMQTSQEELKSTNEELQSTNEELQSSNEELITSKEEMQSLNEELQTVNIELQSKVTDFTRSNNDMKNLLNSTDIATLFLDKELNIRRFTDQLIKIFKLRLTDIGRPFTDMVSDLQYPDIELHAKEVLRTLVYKETAVATNSDDWFNVRIMPYRTFDDKIDGLVITFINITKEKKLEAQLTHLLEKFTQTP